MLLYCTGGLNLTKAVILLCTKFKKEKKLIFKNKKSVKNFEILKVSRHEIRCCVNQRHATAQGSGFGIAEFVEIFITTA